MKLAVCAHSCPVLVTWWSVAHQAPLSMGFSRQEHWSGLPFPPQGDLPNPGIKPASPALQANSLPLHHLRSPYLLVVILYSLFPPGLGKHCCLSF